MNCPECGHWIREEEHYLMSQRIPKDQPLPEHMKRLGTIGGYLIVLLLLSFAFHLFLVNT